MAIQIQPLFQAYDDLAKIIHTHTQWEQDFIPIKTIFEAKKQVPDANIMMYGVYNAGKSTVINALVGKEVAATGDVPLTNSVAAYQCGHISIWDTPGIDAPKEHEQVTETQLLKADAIVFVVNPSGVVEEEKTLSVLMNLFKQGKKVFLVFNPKNELSDEDFILLKDQTRQQLQYLARTLDMQNVLKDIPILRLNAKLALQAKLENHHDLLEYSGYLEFEQALNQFVQDITPEDAYGRLKSALLSLMQKILEQLQNSSQSELVKEYDQLIHLASGERVQIRKHMASLIERYQTELAQSIKSWLYNEQSSANFQPLLDQWVDTKTQLLASELNLRLEEVQHRVQLGLNQLEALVPKIKVATLQAEGIEAADIDGMELKNDVNSSTAFDLNYQNITLASNMIKSNITTEGMITTLNLVKKYLPTLMKGIGPKTIEKLAQTIVGKAIPALGVVVSVGVSIYDIFKEDEETKALRQQQEQMDLARERRQQQINEVSIQIAEQFKVGTTQTINDVIDVFFDGVLTQLTKIQNQFNEQDQQNSEFISQVLMVQREAVSA